MIEKNHALKEINIDAYKILNENILCNEFKPIDIQLRSYPKVLLNI